MAKTEGPMPDADYEYYWPKPRHREEIPQNCAREKQPLKEGIPHKKRMKRDTTDGW